MSDSNDSAPVSNESTPVENSTTEQVAPEVKVPNIKKLKYKVDGKEFEESLNLDDEESLRHHVQMSKAAQKRMSEAANEKKQVQQFVRALKENPLAVLNNPSLGLDFRKLAEQYLLEEIQRETMSPEQIKLKQAEKIIQERENEFKSKREKEEQAQIEQLQSHYVQEYEKTIVTALSDSGLPKNPMTVKRMAELMQKNIQHGMDLEPKDLARLVREELVSELQSIVGDSDGDSLLSLLGDGVSDKIRKHDLASLNKKMMNQSKQVSPSTSEKQEKRSLSRDEWREQLAKRIQE